MEPIAPVTVASVEVFLLELPLREPFVAGHGKTTVRTITVARIDTDRGQGWGECSALPAATYTDESAAGTFGTLCEAAPALIGRSIDARSVSGHGADTRLGPMARACVEMAVLDANLTADGRSMADWLGVAGATVPAGVSIGLDRVAATADRAVDLAQSGYGRLKVKIQPGHDRDLVRAIRDRLPDVELHVDANGTYGPGDIETLCRLVDAGVDGIEQPFPASEPEAAKRLIHRLGVGAVPVVADESVQSLADYDAVRAAGALSGLSIKPARVGGLFPAFELHQRCLSDGVPATAGGMLETGLGRHSLATVAALPGFTVTGDLSPAGRWLAADPWPDLTMTDGRLAVPDQPGVAPAPDFETLSRFTAERRLIDRAAT